MQRAAVILLPIGESADKTNAGKTNAGKTKYEVRVKEPNVTPGYWKRDDLTREAFDEEGVSTKRAFQNW